VKDKTVRRQVHIEAVTVVPVWNERTGEWESVSTVDDCSGEIIDLREDESSRDRIILLYTTHVNLERTAVKVEIRRESISVIRHADINSRTMFVPQGYGYQTYYLRMTTDSALNRGLKFKTELKDWNIHFDDDTFSFSVVYSLFSAETLVGENWGFGLRSTPR
jgi:hypothetical protein